MTVTRTDADGPRTVRMTEDTLHLALREVVYCATSVESVVKDVVRSADPRRDAWVLAHVRRLELVVEAADAAAETLQAGAERL